MDANFLPKPVEFRQWAEAALTKTGTSANQWSLSAGLSQNAVNRFIGKPDPDIKLSTAHDLVADMVKRAYDRQLLLPPLNPTITPSQAKEPKAHIDVSIAVAQAIKILAEREGITAGELVERMTHDFAEKTGAGFVVRALEVEPNRSAETA